MILARKVNLCELPETLDDEFLKLEQEICVGPIREFTESGEKKKSAPAVRYPITEKLQQWLDQNIKKTYHRVIIMKCDTAETSDTFSCHTDITREWALIYYHKAGGDESSLNYYQESGYDVIRGLDHRCNDYNKLTKIASFYPKEKEWWLVKTDVLHDVKGMNQDRITLQLSYWNHTVPDMTQNQKEEY